MPRQLKRFGWLTVLVGLLTFPLIGLGAIVRLKGAGLACPDWPLCYGRITPINDVVAPPPDGVKIALEVGHRYLAGFVGLLVLGLTAWAWWSKDELFEKAKLRTYTSVALFLLIPQAVLGGLTVIMDLAPSTVASHLLFGNLFFASLIGMAMKAFWVRERNAGGGVLSRLGRRVDGVWLSRGLTVLIGLTALQLFVGGWVAATEARVACPDFPTCHGSWLPPGDWYAGIQYGHRCIGFALFGTTGLMCAYTWTRAFSGFVRTMMVTLVGLLGLQIGLGWYNVVHYVPVPTSALHTMVATVFFAVLVFLKTLDVVINDR